MVLRYLKKTSREHPNEGMLAVLRGTETLGMWLLWIMLVQNWDAPNVKLIQSNVLTSI